MNLWGHKHSVCCSKEEAGYPDAGSLMVFVLAYFFPFSVMGSSLSPLFGEMVTHDDILNGGGSIIIKTSFRFPQSLEVRGDRLWAGFRSFGSECQGGRRQVAGWFVHRH